MTHTAAFNATAIEALLTPAQKTNIAPTWELIMNYFWNALRQVTFDGVIQNKFSPAQDLSKDTQDVNGAGAYLISDGVTSAAELEEIGTILLTDPYARERAANTKTLDLYPY